MKRDLMRKSADCAAAQHQGPIEDQLRELVHLGDAHGLYDAADWLRWAIAQVIAGRECHGARVPRALTPPAAAKQVVYQPNDDPVGVSNLE